MLDMLLELTINKKLYIYFFSIYHIIYYNRLSEKKKFFFLIDKFYVIEVLDILSKL